MSYQVRQFLHKPATTEQIFQAIARVLLRPKISEAKVLIVDDDPITLARLAALLTPLGLEVTTLSEPQQFCKVLFSTIPDLLVLDIEMPTLTGLELCQVVRQDAQLDKTLLRHKHGWMAVSNCGRCRVTGHFLSSRRVLVPCARLQLAHPADIDGAS